MGSQVTGSLTLSDIRATLQPETAKALLRLCQKPVVSRAASSFLVSDPVLPPRRQPQSTCVSTGLPAPGHLCLCVCRPLCVSRRVHLCLCLSQAASRAVHLLVPLPPSWTSARSPDSPGARAKLLWAERHPPLLWP